jgi:hypothetical protein
MIMKTTTLQKILGLSTGLSCALCLFFGQNSFAGSRKSQVTGTVEHQPDSSFSAIGVSAQSSEYRYHSSRPVQISSLDNTRVPNFASELNSVMSSDDMIRDMDNMYADRLREFSMYNGFFATMDVGARPGFRGNIPREEAALRQDMAKSIQKWMLLRGIPKFFQSKPATRQYAQAYEHVAQNTKLQYKTESNWEYKTGVNLYQLRAYAGASKGSFSFEASSPLPAVGLTGPIVNYKKYVLLTATKGLGNSHYTAFTSYDYFAKNLVPGISRSFSSKLNASLSSNIPLAEVYVGKAAVTTISMNYAF